MTIEQIAPKCGFSDPDYFLHIFRRNMQISPGDYRFNRPAIALNFLDYPFLVELRYLFVRIPELCKDFASMLAQGRRMQLIAQGRVRHRDWCRERT